MTGKLAARAGCILLGFLLTIGCNDKKASPSVPASTTDAGRSSSFAAQASAVVSASASAARLNPPDPTQAKKWNGIYEAKTVTLETPKKVKDFTWKKDDGATATGKGQLTMSVNKGVIEGDASGPLGPQQLSGVLDDNTLRLKLFPSDPKSATAMTGTGLGKLKDGVISGKLRCAGPKGVVVREVSFELKPAQ